MDLLSQDLSRRTLLKGGAVLLLAAHAPSFSRTGEPRPLNAWVAIGPGDRFTLALAHAEMGQGITTTLPAILADELEIEFAKVDLINADFSTAFRHPFYQWQFTGNSESIATYADLVRAAGAAARMMLLAAAAHRLGVAAADLQARSGCVWHGRTALSYAALADAAAAIRPPDKPVLKPPALRRPLAQARVDIPAKVDGSAVFGIDVKVAGCLSAAVCFAPSIGGQLTALDEAAILAAPGVRNVVRLDGAYAVIADRWWLAQQALALGQPQWSGGLTQDSAALMADYRAKLDSGPFRIVKEAGSAPAAGGRTITADFHSPYQAHATMEPMNCTVRVTAAKCEIWAPTQGMEMTHLVARRVTGLPDDAIVIHRTYLGGGFGRRLLGDFIKQAILIAQAVGRPVKTLWSREADFRGDFYRPAMLHRVSAVLGDDGMPQSMVHRVVSPSMLLYAWPRGAFPQLADATLPVDPPEAYDLMPVEGIIEPLYELPHLNVGFHRLKSEVPVSVWRTTGHGPNNWVLESFVDDCAHAAGIDPVRYRQRLLKSNPKALARLEALIEHAGLDRPAPAGEFRGLAIASGFGSLIAQAVTLSVDDQKAIRLHRVVSVVDLGQVLDREIATRNIEGGIVWGLSALRTEVPFIAGGTSVSNFDRFDPLHLWETPSMETHFIDDGGKPGGVGEIGPVPTLAAVCNAIRIATGVRIQELPITRQGFSIA
ncbi:MAG TPA: molybdopterin cofactor-binding domain-containing protein [Burkholderiaceae bacterium]